jgi:NhaP-type Na+/H+ or K+/H+ antiporter
MFHKVWRNPPNGGKPLKNKGAFITLLVSQIVFALLLLPWIVFLGLSTMMFDAPDSVNNGTLLFIYFMIMIYPVGLVVGIVSSWICYAFRKFKWAYVLNFVPLLWVVPIFGFWGYAWFS